jgi:two-component system, chemotaxis family, protein-glutamate methylesterase/glutaminase
MRKLLEGIFREEGDFTIEVARNGGEALDLVQSFDPDVVTLDVRMPGMDGLTCLSKIMIQSPRPVVMISSLTGEGAEATLEAIELGAVDFVVKPGGAVSLEIDRLRPVLVRKVREAATVKIRQTLHLAERIRHRFRGAGGPSAGPRQTHLETVPLGGDRSAGLVVMGSSTGGPAALDVLLPQLPAGFPWPVMVAQHMPASFTGAFARRLDRVCPMEVVEVSRPMPLRAGVIYIGRGDADLVVARRASGLNAMAAPASPDYPWRPSVDRLVASAMEHYPAKQLVGVLMTGMGRDGAEEMTKLHHEGGRTIAEAESTAVIWGMPGELVKRGGAGEVRAIEEIAEVVIDWVQADAVH